MPMHSCCAGWKCGVSGPPASDVLASGQSQQQLHVVLRLQACTSRGGLVSIFRSVSTLERLVEAFKQANLIDP